MLDDHILVRYYQGVESALLAKSYALKGLVSSGHIGPLRESLIEEFFSKNLGGQFGVGAGEIIDRNSRVGEDRKDQDVVIFNKDFPHVDLGGPNLYVAESVVASFEVKSCADKGHILAAVKRGHEIKNLSRHFKNLSGARIGYPVPPIRTYLLAFDLKLDPKTSLKDVLDEGHRAASIDYPDMPLDLANRMGIAAPALDGVFILGQGFWHFDNSGLTPSDEGGARALRRDPTKRWVTVQTADSNLFFLSYLLGAAIQSYREKLIDISHYMPDGGLPCSMTIL